MSRNLIKILLVMWTVIAAAALGLLLYGLSHNADFKNIFMLKDKWSGRSMVQKDESVSIDDSTNIHLDFLSADIYVKAGNEGKLRVVERASGKLAHKDKFVISKQGDGILIKENSRNNFFRILSFFNTNKRIELYVPKDYSKKLIVQTSSGNIVLNSDIKLDDLKCSQSSGDFYSRGNISVNNLHVKSTSGNIYLNFLSGSGQVKAVSGNVKVGYSSIAEYSNVGSTSGNVNLIIPPKLSYEFEGNCTSGNINANFPLNYESERRNKAYVKEGTEPYKKINAGTVSGNIDIYKNN